MKDDVLNDEVLEYIQLFQKAYPGISPSYREIGSAFGLSTSTVSKILQDLIADGLIVVYREGNSRSVSIKDGYFLTKRDLSELGIQSDIVERFRETTRNRLEKTYGEVD